MKNIALLFILSAAVIVTGTAFKVKNKADKGIQFYQGNFKEALALAKKENKVIFMDAYASWCGPCKRMAANTFTDGQVGDFFNKHFVNLKVDMEKGEGPAIAQKYPVEFYPTLFFIDKNGKIVKKLVGYQDAAALLKEAADVK